MEQDTTTLTYSINFDMAEKIGRNLSLLISSKKCYTDKQADTNDSIINSNPQEHLDRIAEHCSDTPDYLLPDTPIKDAVFRIFLANGNRPMTAEEVSEDLTSRWYESNYPRDLEPQKIAQILEKDHFYCISPHAEQVK